MKTFLILSLLTIAVATTATGQLELTKCEEFLLQRCTPATSYQGSCQALQDRCCQQLAVVVPWQCGAIADAVHRVIMHQREQKQQPWDGKQLTQTLKTICNVECE